MTVFAAACDNCRAMATGSIDRAIRLSTAAAVLVVAGIAAYVSYWHAYAVVRAHGAIPIRMCCPAGALDRKRGPGPRW